VSKRIHLWQSLKWVFVVLKKGDVVSIRNFLSTSAAVNTIANAGGEAVGNNAVFMMAYLRPVCHPKK